jgi:hypothetical protein
MIRVVHPGSRGQNGTGSRIRNTAKNRLILRNLDSDLHAEHERGGEEGAELDEEASVPAPNISKLHRTAGMGRIQPAPVHLNTMQQFHQTEKT